ncbi:MAG: hypothetical protein JHC26_11885 [Thermofilum sp.]|jgi:hypothetical protein|uniref:hypothetical protein n=1 Tax=Thermofilum sp. TaxID=1961369 RepID=UPI002585FB2E|nr:hypothetical protein [Thermofilum sp.]MCI4409784.1 hypothetical protein [Thermofilum sp.]
MKGFEVKLGGKTVKVEVVFNNTFEKASMLTIERHTSEGIYSDTFHLMDARLTGEKVLTIDGLELLAVIRDKSQLERVLKNHILPHFAEEQPDTITVIIA